MKMSIGVDLHKGQFTVCYLAEDRRNGSSGIYRTNDEGYQSFISECRKYVEGGYELRVAVESTGNARYFCNRLAEAGIETTVVNTLKFKVVNESVKKTDKHDARTLAEFLEKEMLPEAHLCSQRNEDLRRVIKTREILVKSLVSVKNQVHGLLLGYGIETKRGQLQSKRERQRILDGLVDHDFYGLAAKAVEPLFDTIDQLSSQVKKLERLLERMVERERNVEILRSIPGVGLITAATITAYVDDIHRFGHEKKFAAYMGLAPWVQNSNEQIHHGHITRRGPVELRTAMVQCVLGMVRMSGVTESYRIMRRYRSMKKNKGSGQSIIAAARKLSTIIYSMLKHGEPFDPTRMAYNKKYVEMQTAAWDVERKKIG
jgi:transposase